MHAIEEGQFYVKQLGVIITARLAKRAKVMFSLCVSVHRGGGAGGGVPRSNIFGGGGGPGGVPRSNILGGGGGAGPGPGPPPPQKKIFYFILFFFFEIFFFFFFL